MSRGIMVVGTTSHAGKSLITAAICRLLARKGEKVTPFKGQNMALNAYVTAAGEEIGHAQAVQSWAAGLDPRVEMNPILLKPQGDMTSQVVIMGKVVGTVNAADYYRDYFDRGWAAIVECLEKLKTEFDYIVCEGAGSPAEINLKHRDLTNMRVASYLNAPTLLVADIDRGGVFAHIVGTLELLEPKERALIKGVVINKFRGHRSLLESGLTWLEERTGIPVLGVIPYFQELYPSEDSLDLLERKSRKPNADLQIGVVRFPKIGNFTDFDPLDAEPSVNLQYIDRPEKIAGLDAVILPGSKTTIADLEWMRDKGIGTAIEEFVAKGGMVTGICGGWQMMGKTIVDELGIEGIAGEYPGLNLMPIATEMTDDKITRQREIKAARICEDRLIRGYEIHRGKTKLLDENNSYFQPLFADTELGIINDDRTLWGTYLHGIFDNGKWRRQWLNHLRQQRNLSSLPTDIEDYQIAREKILDNLATTIEPHLNLEPLLGF